MRIILPRMGRSKRIARSLTRMEESVRMSRVSDKIAESIWEMIVAAAAPATPMPNTAIKRRSSTTFMSEEKIR